ncbi:hypothetical protein [Actinomadura rupiterrae]|uniref:hypothetical protein n=1 Tax=Actinomadura rupiterrae TaxID=559627 RepID=UPI0020A3D475|nr:hypothetical protein [Actinomadura rupiterrae]MCP2340527.1 hypothetical protein [Actinomadura rupiterrae]
MRRTALALGTMGIVSALTTGTALAAPADAHAAKAHGWNLSVKGGKANGAYTVSSKGFKSTLNLKKTAKNGKYLVFWHRQATKGGKWGRPGVNWTKSNALYKAAFSAPETGYLQATLCWADKVYVHKNHTVSFKNLKCAKVRTWKLAR